MRLKSNLIQLSRGMKFCLMEWWSAGIGRTKFTVKFLVQEILAGRVETS